MTTTAETVTGGGDAVMTNGDTKDENMDSLGNNVFISGHPVLAHKVSILRSSSTPPSSFRAVLREITFYVGYEATSSLTTRTTSISVPFPDVKRSTANRNGGGRASPTTNISVKGKHLAEKKALVPIMRSGLGMVDAMLELLPNSAVYHVGMYKRDQMPVMYYNRLPKKCDVDVVYVLDPLIATATTVMSVVGILKKWGVPKIHIIAVIGSRQGINALSKAHPDVSVTVGELDDLDEEQRLLPGLGDAGDRLFGTPMMMIDENGTTNNENDKQEEDAEVSSKRKKTDAE